MEAVIVNTDPVGDTILRARFADALNIIGQRAYAQIPPIPFRYAWQNETFSLYVRVTSRVIDPVEGNRLVMRTIDLSSVEIAHQYQRRGLFKYIVRELQSIAKDTARVLYVENVLNKHLDRWFERQADFKLLRQTDGPSCNCYAYIP